MLLKIWNMELCVTFNYVLLIIHMATTPYTLSIIEFLRRFWSQWTDSMTTRKDIKMEENKYIFIYFYSYFNKSLSNE